MDENASRTTGAGIIRANTPSDLAFPINKGRNHVRIRNLIDTKKKENAAREQLRTEGVENFESAQFTCNRCSIRFECNCAFDTYNLNGECLMEK